jgi:hypothetical protein
MTIKIQGKDCAFCLLYVAKDEGDYDYECLLHARDRVKDGPGETCPGPGEYDFVPVGGAKRMSDGFGTLAARCAGLEKENAELKSCLEGASLIILSATRENEAKAIKKEAEEGG